MVFVDFFCLHVDDLDHFRLNLIEHTGLGFFINETNVVQSVLFFNFC